MGIDVEEKWPLFTLTAHTIRGKAGPVRLELRAAGLRTGSMEWASAGTP